MSKTFDEFENWSRSYFGHGMPPSQNYFESCMSAWHCAWDHQQERIEAIHELNRSLVNRYADQQERIGAQARRIEMLGRALKASGDRRESLERELSRRNERIDELEKRLEIATELIKNAYLHLGPIRAGMELFLDDEDQIREQV